MHWTDQYSTIFFDELDSTNLEAKRLIEAGVSGKHVVVAAKQHLGMGRSGKNWDSPFGNLYFSIVLDHSHDLSSVSQLSLVASLSCCEAMQSMLSDDLDLLPKIFKIKWPNDIFLNGKKFCGILLQAFPRVEAGVVTNHLVIGIGVNLVSSPTLVIANEAEGVKGNNYYSTSLKEEGVAYGSLEEVLHRIMERFNKNYKLWQDKGFSAIREGWLMNAYNSGKEVSANINGEKIAGIFKTIDEEGLMIIELKSGILHKVITCDVYNV